MANIGQVIKTGANFFAEPGFAPAAAADRLQAASLRENNDIKLLNRQLMTQLSQRMAQNHLKQAEAAKILMVSRPLISDVVTGKTTKFTFDALVAMLGRAGKPVKLAIGQSVMSRA